MTNSPLGRTLVIANPAAGCGEGERARVFAERFLASFSSATEGYEILSTEGPGDARGLARMAGEAGFSSVIALGGDGVIHEVVNGLMALRQSIRPALGIIPMGSGNDYARTIGMAKNHAEDALAQLVQGQIVNFEVGQVNDVYFMQTLSFGLDAAVAIDTIRRREKNTSLRGESLYVTSALKLFPHARRGWPCRAHIDGGHELILPTIIFTVQIGPTYGGGFQVCPAANPCDGVFDLCYNISRPALPHLAALLGMVRAGTHTRSRVLRLRQAKTIELAFETPVPAQVDGEELEGQHFDIQVIPQALRVICPTPATRTNRVTWDAPHAKE
ncbi:diacylglycerol kinase family lipid kinase [Collinsella sp. AGMB00827]|uniref:Diacylglycerol kinase family lipid kinase n=1 Tax=Collinsella ureilytica TaxID=2869515 RepID=A0ABS7MLH5_9ACTN|nr:diacylglycerol kinase family protein [Collinsella urealyticum]MBY4798214.1 diacylglycerol kinase family lipid kinase [Collinsella urealyticum]